MLKKYTANLTGMGLLRKDTVMASVIPNFRLTLLDYSYTKDLRIEFIL